MYAAVVPPRNRNNPRLFTSYLRDELATKPSGKLIILLQEESAGGKCTTVSAVVRQVSFLLH